jgi:hypothetical protein
MTCGAWWIGLGVLLSVSGLGCGGDDGPGNPVAKLDGGLALDAAADGASPPDRPAADALAGDTAPGLDSALLCQGPVAGCTAGSAGACDLVCQARCGCQQRCALVSGMPACVPPASVPIPTGGACSADLDDCQAGSVCLAEAAEVCGSHCYRYCRDDADCPAGAQCNFEVEVGGAVVARACGVAPESCDPVEGRCAAAGRPSPTFGCYVLSAGASDVAACDCAGTRKLGEGCMFEHECLPGLECIKVAGQPSACRKVCRLGMPATCPAGAQCLPLGTAAAPSTVFGYCAM